MEGIAPPLKCILHLQQELSYGKSVFSSCQSYIDENHDSFSIKVQEMLIVFQQEQDLSSFLRAQHSFHRKTLLKVIFLGLKGHPISEELSILEEEISQAAESELNKFLKDLPMKALVPLFLFCFPAFLLLLFGPFLRELLSQWQGGM